VNSWFIHNTYPLLNQHIIKDVDLFRSGVRLCNLLCLFFMLLPMTVLAESSASEYIKQYMVQLKQSGELELEGIQIASRQVVPKLYERRDYSPVWSNTESLQQLFNQIRLAYDEGLNPNDYNLDKLKELQLQLEHSPQDPAMAATYDVLLSDALFRLTYHLMFGKVDPETFSSHWNLARDINKRDPVEVMQNAINDATIKQILDTVSKFNLPQYANMKAGLKKYRELAELGGWNTIVEGETLKYGMQDARVTELRKRLVVTGDLPLEKSTGDTFDNDVEVAVKHFQVRHGLNDDGAVGPATLRALNVPIEQRIDQIRVNLERMRWVMHGLPDTFVVADIAGYELYYIRDAQLVWRTRTQVGKPYRETPVFRGLIEYMEFNPTWTVPPTILKKDILPKLKKNPAYLETKKLQVLTGSGKVVDPDTIDWKKYTARNFPYILRQTPGPHNALGQVKFIFPNKHFVFIHDSPSRNLYNRTTRTFSSGCIRVENPLKLAEYLLEEKPDWDRTRIDKVIDAGKTRRVHLDEKIPVLLFYWTVTIEQDGSVRFKEDPYGRDDRVLASLDGKFKLRKRDLNLLKGFDQDQHKLVYLWKIYSEKKATFDNRRVKLL